MAKARTLRLTVADADSARRLFQLMARVFDDEAAGIEDIFVPADNDDSDALDFYRSLGGEPASVTHFTFRSTDS